MTRNVLLTLIGTGFVALALSLMALGKEPWTSPDAWGAITFFAGCAAVGLIDTWQGAFPPRSRASDAARLALHYERARMGTLGFAGALWFACGVIGLYGVTFPLWLAWLIIVFGGLCAAVLIPIAFDGRAIVTVDAQGIGDLRLLSTRVPWSDVAGIDFGSQGAMPSIEVRLTSPAAYSSKRSLTARLFGRKIQPMQIIDFGLVGSLRDVADAIRRFAPPALNAADTMWDQSGEDEEAEHRPAL